MDGMYRGCSEVPNISAVPEAGRLATNWMRLRRFLGKLAVLASNWR